MKQPDVDLACAISEERERMEYLRKQCGLWFAE